VHPSAHLVAPNRNLAIDLEGGQLFLGAAIELFGLEVAVWQLDRLASAYGMPDLSSAKRNGCGGCSLSLFARYRADPTADCAGVLVTRTDGDERDKEDTEPANVLRQVVRTLIPAALADHRDRA
jgi:hypothetical protein